MMWSITDMSHRKNVLWFQEESYQWNTTRELKATLIYDQINKTITVFKRLTKQFVTTCQLTTKEQDYLINNSYFNSELNLTNGKAKNLLRQQISVNNFKRNMMEIPPTSPVDKNSSSNSSFTLINSFENEVIHTTSIDDS